MQLIGGEREALQPGGGFERAQGKKTGQFAHRECRLELLKAKQDKAAGRHVAQTACVLT